MSEKLNKIVALCKRRGFIYQGSDIYGGLRGLFDYGPLGVELKNNLKNSWWKSMVYMREDIEGLDSAILSHHNTFYQSGHIQGFADLMLDCRDCKKRFRIEDSKDKSCPYCKSLNITEARPFNLMFRTKVGPVETDKTYAYLRPETAQGVFINFKNVLDSTSRKLPFGIAQIGKAFRNEITPKNFLFRMREFEQMELEFFVKPGTDDSWHDTWTEERLSWWKNQGISESSLEVYQQTKGELAHYAKKTLDIMYRFPDGPEEIEGIANRTDFDLGSHSKEQESLGINSSYNKNKFSSQKLAYNDVGKNHIVPYVIESSAGLDRGIMSILFESFFEEILDNGSTRVVMKFANHIAPIKVSIIPLAKNNPQLVSTAKHIKDELQKLGIGRIKLENTGNIGKSYRKNDEIGTPICITVDFETIGEGDIENKNTITIRDRDTMKQSRIEISRLREYILSKFIN